jgi:hypothetical protein
MSGSHSNPVSPSDSLARVIVFADWVRATDRKVRWQAFKPSPDLTLSVIRHGTLSGSQLWGLASQVAVQRGRPLVGRADVVVGDVEKHGLGVENAPMKGNPNHAHIIGWPSEKPAQMNKAQHLAAEATFLAAP